MFEFNQGKQVILLKNQSSLQLIVQVVVQLQQVLIIYVLIHVNSIMNSYSFNSLLYRCYY